MHLSYIDPFLLEGWSWYGVFGAVAGTIIFLGALVKALKEIRTEGWQPFKDRYIRPFKARREADRRRREAEKKERAELTRTCETMGLQIREILKEVKPNGGTSLNDRVVRIDDKLDDVIAERQHQNETSQVAIFQLDADGQMIFTNCAFRELVNAEDDQLLHNNYLSLIDDDDRRRFIRSRDEAIRFKMPLDAIVKFKIHGPHMVSVRLQATPDVRHGGVLKRFFGTANKVEVE